MKWLSQYRLKDHDSNKEIYLEDRTGHKVMLKKTKIQSGVIEVGVLQKLVGNAFPRLLDYKICGNEMHIALQFIEGKTLNSIEQTELCSYTANQLLLNALVSVDEIHRTGFMHCDIKPHNMLYDSQFHVYIIDFGTAQQLTHKRPRSEWRGTTQYMPPEALYTPEQIDIRSDYYSLGKSFEKCFDHKMEYLSYNAINCLKMLSAIIPDDRPSSLSDLIKTLRY